MNRTTALQTVERKSFGGSAYDSLTHSMMFRSYKPHNFGIKGAQLFSSKLGSHLINKKFTYYTASVGNIHTLPGGVDDYEWSLIADADVDFRISELLVNPTGFAGKNKARFKIALDRDWVHEPCLLKCENANLPLIRIIGYPKKRSANSFEYECELQTSDLNAYIPVSYLMPEKRFIDASTSVSDELNQKGAGVSFGEMFKLQSWTGNYARKATFSDKFVRTEIACRNEGRQLPKSSTYNVGGKQMQGGAIGVGYTYTQPFNLTNGGSPEVVNKGVFITKIEAMLEDRIMQDREMNMEFGHLEKTVDSDSGRTMKVAPGWRQLVRDGHLKVHSGGITLSEIYEYLAEIFLTRREHSDRRIVLSSGEAGVELLHRLIAAEASQYQYIDTLFTQKRNDPQGYHDNELQYGAQFTKIKLPMGYILEIAYDPIKDDRKLFPEKAPGTNRTIESYSMDIFDFGQTDQKAIGASRSENMTMVMQDGVESYYTVSNVYNFETGAINDGSNAYSNNKELSINREMSGSLCTWDASRIGRIEFRPVSIV